MNHGIACLVTASLALGASSCSNVSASTPGDPGPGVEILIDGVAQRRYLHDGRFYIEARKGAYAIRLRNPYGVRVGVALAVDGLNTIDARQTTAADARKWVLNPYETAIISGWQTSQTEARFFTFTTEARSYGQALGKTANLGVISAVFFKERLPVAAHEFALESSPREAQGRSVPPARDALQAPGADAKDNAYAATGMGSRTDHPVTQVWLALEDVPAQSVNIRYEFRPQLVRLGIVPSTPVVDPLVRREHAQGFTPEFCPIPGHKH